MRLFLMTIPELPEVAASACRHFALAAGPSALVTILSLSMIEVHDQAISPGGVQTLLWTTILFGLASAALHGARSERWARASRRRGSG